MLIGVNTFLKDKSFTYFEEVKADFHMFKSQRVFNLVSSKVQLIPLTTFSTSGQVVEFAEFHFQLRFLCSLLRFKQVPQKIISKYKVQYKACSPAMIVLSVRIKYLEGIFWALSTASLVYSRWKTFPRAGHFSTQRPRSFSQICSTFSHSPRFFHQYTKFSPKSRMGNNNNLRLFHGLETSFAPASKFCSEVCIKAKTSKLRFRGGMHNCTLFQNQLLLSGPAGIPPSLTLGLTSLLGRITSLPRPSLASLLSLIHLPGLRVFILKVWEITRRIGNENTKILLKGCACW